MKIDLLIIAFVVIFNISYVETIQCYVCNTLKDKDCETDSLTNSALKDCDAVEKERYNQYLNAIEDKKKIEESQPNYPDPNMTNHHLNVLQIANYSSFMRTHKFKEGKASQCSKISVWVEGTERIFRDCTGLVSKSDTSGTGCHKIVMSDSRIKSTQCYCQKEKCNSSNRRLHSNGFWLNIILPIIISFANFVLN